MIINILASVAILCISDSQAIRSKHNNDSEDENNGIQSAAEFDPSNWNVAKKDDCYFKGLNNLVSDGLMHLDDGTAVDCETGHKVNPADFTDM